MYNQYAIKQINHSDPQKLKKNKISNKHNQIKLDFYIFFFTEQIYYNAKDRRLGIQKGK